jgi:peroxiredoxin
VRKIRVSIWAVFGALLFLFGTNSAAAASTPQKGDMLPEINLTIPEDAAQRNYLGLSGEGPFKVSQIKAPVVLVEIFSMYCPACQREAPRVNELYEMIEKNPKLKGKIKIIGIGAGNSPFEVNVFRRKYKIPFPLFADDDFTIHKCLGEVRTPYFIAVKTKAVGTHEVFYSLLGGFKNADDFLDQLVDLSELK